MNLAATPGGLLSRLVAIALFGIPICIWDLRHRRIPDRLTISAFVTGGALWVMTSQGPWWEMAIAVSLGLLIPLTARITTGGGLGWGDIKLSASLALFVGWPGILVALGTGATVALGCVVVGGTSRNEAGVPFGPFLIVGAIIALTGEVLPGESFL